MLYHPLPSGREKQAGKEMQYSKSTQNMGWLERLQNVRTTPGSNDVASTCAWRQDIIIDRSICGICVLSDHVFGTAAACLKHLLIV